MYDLSIQNRFWAKVDKSGDCWLWTACTNELGYGRFGIGPKIHKAHRVSYALANGPIPNGIEIDHICRTPGCVNPAHLRGTTHKQNLEHVARERPNTASGVRGVNWDKRTKKWRARLRHNYAYIELGKFDTIGEAEVVVVAKRNELFTHNNLDRVA